MNMFGEECKGGIELTTDAAAAQSEAEAGTSHNSRIFTVGVLVDLCHTSFTIPQRDCLQTINSFNTTVSSA